MKKILEIINATLTTRSGAKPKNVDESSAEDGHSAADDRFGNEAAADVTCAENNTEKSKLDDRKDNLHVGSEEVCEEPENVQLVCSVMDIDKGASDDDVCDAPSLSPHRKHHDDHASMEDI